MEEKVGQEIDIESYRPIAKLEKDDKRIVFHLRKKVSNELGMSCSNAFNIVRRCIPHMVLDIEYYMRKYLSIPWPWEFL
jgi:hypothetical protein